MISLNGVENLEEHLLAGHHYEKVYPYDTAGVTLTPGNTVWGLTTVIIPIDAINNDYGWSVGNVCSYKVVGFTYMLNAGASKPNTIQFFRVVKSTAQVLDDDALSTQAVIPVPLTGGFLVGDQVWIVDDNTAAGELREIDSIITDTSITVTVNLTGDYTTAQNAVVYLIRRKGSNSYRTIWDKFAHSNTKSVITHYLHSQRILEAGDGILARALGIDDASGVMLVSVKFHHANC